MNGLQASLVKIGAAGFACLCIGFAAVIASPGNASPIEIPHSLALQERSSTAGAADQKTVEDRFAGAPDGVDPVVTGPVSVAFKQKRAFLNCDDAQWPNVPAACYPD